MAGTSYEPTIATTSARSSSFARHWVWIAVALIGIGALALRIWGIRGGLPYVDHPDEPNPINYVVQMLKTGDLNPHFFQKPSLYIYMLLAVLSVHYRLGLQSGLYTALDQMTVTTHQYTTIPGFFLWGRMLTATIASFTVGGVFWLGRQAWSNSAGLCAALFLATAQFHLQHSQYVTTDVASGFFVLLCFICTLTVTQKGRWRDYLLAGLLSGLAASTKYNAGVVALPIVVAHFLYWKRKSFIRLPRLIGAGLVSMLGFTAGTPYALLSWREFVKGFTGQVVAYNDGSQGDFSGIWNWRGYTSFFWDNGLLAPGCIAVLAGIGLLIWHKRAIGILWLSFAVPYLILLLAQSTHFLRNLIPLYVICMLPLGVACANTNDWLRQRITRFGYVATAVLLLIVLLPTSSATYYYMVRLGRGDSRVQMLHWIAANIPPGARIGAELKPLPGPLDSPWATLGTLTVHDLAWYRQQGYAYLIASSDQWRRWEVPAEYATFAGSAPIAEFGGATSRDMFGPHLLIYATGLSATDIPNRLNNDVQIGGARLLGSTISNAQTLVVLGANDTIQAGATLGLRTFWQVEQPFNQDFFIFVHIVNKNGQTVAQRDTPPWQGRFPTSSWRSGTLVVDVNDLALPDQLAAGDYTIVAGMFDPNTGAHPTLQIDGKTSDHNEVQIGSVRVSQ